MLDVAYTLHSEIGNHCIAGKVNHKLVPLSQKLNSGDQVEVLTSQSQTPKPEWMTFLSTAKAKTRLRKELRREQQPFIDKGKKIFEHFLEENSITLNNDVMTKILGTYHVTSREELFLRLGNGEASIDDYLNVNTSSSARSLVSRLLRLGFGGGGKKKEAAKPKPLTPPAGKINTKETYILRFNDTERNFKLSDCCRPIPGDDDVMGFINDDGIVEIHSLTCPRAQVLKASYGPRILAVKWESVTEKFLAKVRIEGIDRHGILQELTRLISTALDIDIRSMNIQAHEEVFSCDLTVKVRTTDDVDALCSKVMKIKGVKRADRLR